jgi:hypothetical protein
MYYEIERLILDSIVVCSYCESTNVKNKGGMTTTLAAFGENSEDSFNDHVSYHTHDTNTLSTYYECMDCYKKFAIQPLNACWCGWKQSYKNGGSKFYVAKQPC